MVGGVVVGVGRCDSITLEYWACPRYDTERCYRKDLQRDEQYRWFTAFEILCCSVLLTAASPLRWATAVTKITGHVRTLSPPLCMYRYDKEYCYSNALAYYEQCRSSACNLLCCSTHYSIVRGSHDTRTPCCKSAVSCCAANNTCAPVRVPVPPSLVRAQIRQGALLP